MGDQSHAHHFKMT